MRCGSPAAVRKNSDRQLKAAIPAARLRHGGRMLSRCVNLQRPQGEGGGCVTTPSREIRWGGLAAVAASVPSVGGTLFPTVPRRCASLARPARLLGPALPGVAATARRPRRAPRPARRLLRPVGGGAAFRAALVGTLLSVLPSLRRQSPRSSSGAAPRRSRRPSFLLSPAFLVAGVGLLLLGYARSSGCVANEGPRLEPPTPLVPEVPVYVTVPSARRFRSAATRPGVASRFSSPSSRWQAPR